MTTGDDNDAMVATVTSAPGVIESDENDLAKLREISRQLHRRLELAKLAIAWARQTGDPILQNAECVALFDAVQALFAIEGKVSE